MSAFDAPTTGALVQVGDRKRWLVPGDVVGRHHRCAFSIADPRLSEAHAMASIRGGDLHLLCLRGGLRIAGKPTRDPRLRLGVSIELAPGLCLSVEEIRLPARPWFIAGPGIDAMLERPCSIVIEPEPHLVPGSSDRAALHLWNDGESWHTGSGGSLKDGDVLCADTWQGRIERRQVLRAGLTATVPQRNPLRVECHYDTAHIQRQGVHSLTLNGVQARIVHELAEIDGPIHWSLVARTIWREGADQVVRRRWDKTLSRLRAQLREAGIRDDLIHASGRGQVEILRYPADVIVVLD